MAAQTYNSTMKDLQGYFKEGQPMQIYKALETDEEKLLMLILMRTGRRITEVIGRKAYINHNTRLGIHKEYPEIMGLCPKDINFEEGLAAFNILKKKRVMRKLKALDEKTLIQLKEYVNKYEIPPEQPIFSINRFRFYYALRKAAKSVGIEYVGNKPPHPHNFRHTFAIRIIKQSKKPEDLRMLQQTLEHSSLETTAHYLQFSQEDQKALISKAFSSDEE